MQRRKEDYMIDLKEKVVVITGATGGIGAATAKLLAKEGAKIVLSDIDEEALKEEEQALIDEGGEVSYIAADVTKMSELENLVKETLSRHDKIDVFFSNAGLLLSEDKVHESDSDEISDLIDVNVKGVINGVLAILPYFKEQDAGHIVSTASIASHMVQPQTVAYSATKHAVRIMMEGLKKEEAETKIRFTTISPGVVDTDMGEGLVDDATDRFTALDPKSIAEGILFALTRDEEVNVREMIISPTKSPD